jgi:hypothetical protein
MMRRKVKSIAYRNHLQVLSRNPLLDGVMGVGSNPHCSAYTHFDGAILDKPCKASPHDYLSQP